MNPKGAQPFLESFNPLYLNTFKEILKVPLALKSFGFEYSKFDKGFKGFTNQIAH